MRSMTLEIEDPENAVWTSLPPAAQKLLTEKALNALLNGRMFPTGTDKLDLAIDLAEAGVDAETISKLSHLDRSIFEEFMPQ